MPIGAWGIVWEAPGSDKGRPWEMQDFVFPDKNDSYLERLAYLCYPQQIAPDGASEWAGSAAARSGGKWDKAFER